MAEITYRILPIKRMVRIEFFSEVWVNWRSSILAHTSMIADRRALAVIAPLHSRCSVSVDICNYNRAREIVNWSIIRSYGEYEQ